MATMMKAAPHKGSTEPGLLLVVSVVCGVGFAAAGGSKFSAPSTAPGGVRGIYSGHRPQSATQLSTVLRLRRNACMAWHAQRAIILICAGAAAHAHPQPPHMSRDSRVPRALRGPKMRLCSQPTRMALISESTLISESALI